jgi:L-histidine Nalpha-methyltransferase
VSKSAPRREGLPSELSEPASSTAIGTAARGCSSEQLGRLRAPRNGPDEVLVVERCLPDGWLARALRTDVRKGLTSSPKRLEDKWHYDEAGSELFEQIMELDVYYAARAERSILAARAHEIAAATGAHTLVDLGCGSASKTRLLLDALRRAGSLGRYVAVDVSETALVGACARVQEEYPGIRVQAVLSDYEERLGLPDHVEPMLVAFLGSTFGLLGSAERGVFLASLRRLLRPGDALLIGTDLVKDPAVLTLAYDDPAGVTAKLNLNVLRRLNTELGADFNLDAFAHVVRWEESNERIKMGVRALADQVVTVDALGLTVAFSEGEEMQTSAMAKFRRDRVDAELAAAGLAMRSWWTDEQGQFGLSLSVPA